jgi:hypothetical protein
MAADVDNRNGSDRRACGTPDLISDCRLMLTYARKNSFILNPVLLHEIGWLDSVLKGLDIAPISLIAPQLIWPIDKGASPPLYVREAVAGAAPPSPAAAAGQSPEEVILDVHSQLSQLIAPTTSLSLQTSEPPAGKRHIFGGMPLLVQVVIVIAFISAVCFAISASQIAGRDVRWKTKKAASAASAAAGASAASATASGGTGS